MERTAAREEWAEPVAMGDRFRVTAEPEAWRVMAAQEVLVAMELQVPMGTPHLHFPLQLAEMAALAEMARSAAMAGLVAREAWHWGRAQPERMETMAMEATGALRAAAELAALAAMVGVGLLFQFPTVRARAVGMAALLDSQALAVLPGERGPQQVRMELSAMAVTAEMAETAET
jgi:hypothetical protein